MTSVRRWALALALLFAGATRKRRSARAPRLPRRDSRSRSASSRSKTIRATSRSAPTSASSSRPANIRLPAPKSASTRRRRLRACCQGDFTLDRITVKSPADVAPAVRAALDAGTHFFLIDAPADAFKPLAAAVRGRDALLFNVSEPDDSLRRDLCAPEFVHVYPSRAQLMDGLVQFAVSRKWRDLLVLEGPSPADAAMTAAFAHSAQKFGARIVAHQHFKPGTDPREREQNDPALLSAINRDFDVGLRRRRRLRFRPHGALSAGAPASGHRQHRSRAGGLALDLGAPRRAAGQFALREEVGRPAHGRAPTGLPGWRSRWSCNRRCARAPPISPNSAPSFSATAVSTATRVSR